MRRRKSSFERARKVRTVEIVERKGIRRRAAYKID